MLKRIALLAALAAAAFAQSQGTGIGGPGVVHVAQNQETPKEPEKFYKLDFVVKEVEGAKVLNARSYVMTVAAGSKDNVSMRNGSRVPVQTSQATYNYVDVGVNIDCRNVKETPRGLSFFVSAEISSVASESTPGTQPTVRQNRWSGFTVVALKKPALVFSGDDLTSKHQMQLEVTATPTQ